MDHLEKVEKLRQRADISYEEAKKALEDCGWDMLDALVMLETQGKVKDTAKEDNAAGPSEEKKLTTTLTVSGSSREESRENQKKQDTFFTKLGRAIKYLIRKGCENSLVIKQHGQVLMDLPIIGFIILLILFFGVVIPIMLISLFFDFSYNFKGPELGKEKVNQAMDSATEAVNHFKSEVNQDDKK